jgi:hypothetical protein
LNGDLYSDNGGKISTRGVEFEAKYIGKFYNGLFNLSYIDPVFLMMIIPGHIAITLPKAEIPILHQIILMAYLFAWNFCQFRI